MTAPKPPRNWMRISTRALPPAPGRAYRQVSPADAELLAPLMDEAYRGTIDHEGETPEQCLEEMRATLTGRYGPFLDFASFTLFDSNIALSASLITLWKEKPLLAYSMTSPSAQGKGHAKFLIERSISALHARGFPELYLVVTEGNPAEGLYRRIGFTSLGPALPGQPPPTN